MLEEFVPLEQSHLSELNIRPKGDTPIGAALNLALDQLSAQEAVYRRNKWSFVTSQLLILSDGKSSDETESAITRLQKLTCANRLLCRGIAVGDDPDMKVLSAIAGDKVMLPEQGAMHHAFAEVGRLIFREYEAEAEREVETAENAETRVSSVAGTEIPGHSDSAVSFLLDGSNMMHWDERHSDVILKYLLAVTRRLDADGRCYLAFFDASAQHRLPATDLAEYENLLQFRPEQFRRVPAGTRADDFLLFAADSTPSCRIMTNDRFRDYEEKYPWLQTGRNRLIPGMLLNGMIFFPSIRLKISL